jgi:hypothetical protein
MVAAILRIDIWLLFVCKYICHSSVSFADIFSSLLRYSFVLTWYSLIFRENRHAVFKSLILGAFAKLRNATVTFVTYVRPPVCPQLDCYLRHVCPSVRNATVTFVTYVRPPVCPQHDCYLRHVCPSARLSATRLLLDGFSWNLIFEYVSNICRRNSSFIKVWQ